MNQAREELQRIADLAFATLKGPVSGYYHGLKEVMSIALSASTPPADDDLQDEVTRQKALHSDCANQLRVALTERDKLKEWQAAAFDAHPNIDRDIEARKDWKATIPVSGGSHDH